MRILILNHNQEGFGTYFRCRSLAEGLSKIGHEVTMICASGRNFDLSIKKQKINQKFTIITLPRVRYYTYYSGQIILRLPLYLYYILTTKYDLLYAFTVAQPQIGIPVMIGKILGKKVIVDWDDLWEGGFASVHNILSNKVLSKSESFFLRFADLVTCASQKLCDKARMITGKKENVFYLPNVCKLLGVKHLGKNKAKQRLGFASSEKFILSMGNTYTAASLDLILDAYRYLLQLKPDVKLIFLSSIVFSEERKKRFKDIFNKISFTGYVSEEVKNLYLQAADVLVLPMESSSIEEARFPIRLGDYLWAGGPIASNAIGEVKYYLEKYKAGLTCSPDSPKEFAKIIFQLLNDKFLSRTLSLNARKLAETELSSKKIIKKADEIISLINLNQSSILILSPFYSPNIGGVETHLEDLCRYLTEKKKHEVYVVTYTPLTTKVKAKLFEKKDNLTIIRVPWIGRNLFHKLESHPTFQFLYLTPVLFTATFIFMLIKSKKIRTIHAHGFTAALIANIIAKIFPRKTLVASMHAIYGFSKNRKLAFICKNILSPFDEIFCLAQKSVDDLLSAGVVKQKLSIYTQWVDQSLFKPRDKKLCRKKINIDDKFTVLYPPSRLIEKKGAGVLLEAIKRCPKSIQFVFVGSGPLEGKISQAAQKSENIIFVGRKSQKEAAIYYGAADVVVVPSQYEEGFARVVLETLSSGRPIIASNLGCLPEMITEEVGYLIQPTADNIAEKIKFLYKNKAKLAYLTKNSRPYALKHFNQKNAEDIERSYFVKY